jgi:hypothetical protein
MKRICIYPKDIQQITGKSERHCRNIINKIKVKYNKQKHQHIIIEEYCDYMGIKPASIENFLK